MTLAATTRFTITGESTYVAIEKVNLFNGEGYINALFSAFKSDAFAERMCTLMEETCTDVWTANEFADQAECQQSVEAMPAADGMYIDGLSQGCRWVHSVLVPSNTDHCEHISTIPLEDLNGNIKCQTSLQNPLSSMFSDVELDFIVDTAMNEFGFDESLYSTCK